MRVRSRRGRGASAVTFTLAIAMALCAGVGTSQAEVSRAPIVVPLLGLEGKGSPYPSTMTVSSVLGPAHKGLESVTLYGVTHPCTEELAILLVHDNVEKYLLLSNAGACTALQGTSVTFLSGTQLGRLPDTFAANPPPGEQLVINASNYGTPPIFPAPAPAGPYEKALSSDVNVNGTWSLYVLDTGGEGRGVIAGGWTLNYSENIELTFPEPISVPATVTGTASHYPVRFDLSQVSSTLTVQRNDMSLVLPFTHGYASDLQMVLQSPAGTAVVLMANAGGNFAFDGTITFSDPDFIFQPAAPLNAQLQSGMYKPGGAYGTHGLPAVGPPPPYATSYAAFHGEPVRGVWTLWIFDDFVSNGNGTFTNSRLEFSFDTGISLSQIGVPQNPTQPFSHLVFDSGSASTPLVPSAVVAIWRVLNNGLFYAAGAMEPVPGQPTKMEADVPLKAGNNSVRIFAAGKRGFGSGISQDVTVQEFTYALAEGATGDFFDFDLTLSNPEGRPAPVTLDFLPEGGAQLTVTDTVAANAPLQRRVDDVVPGGAVSTVIRSTAAVPLAIERTMSWDAGGYGGHGGSAVSPSTRWLFAEGSQGFFDTFVLLANDNSAAVDATVKFLVEGGGTVTQAVSVPPHTRRTIYTGDVPALVDRSFGIDVTATAPVIVERAMYFPHGGPRLFDGGHESAGVNDTSTHWFLAEGATGPFFECFVLVSNPNATDAQVTLSYLLPNGETIPQSLVVPANSRKTINVETLDPRLVNTPVSTTVVSDVGVVVERAMYWPDLSIGWQEAHNSFGVAAPALRWGLADGRIGGPRGHDTYILLANPNPLPAEVRVRFLKPGVAVTRTYTLTPTSRLNIQPSVDVPEIGPGVFGADIQVLNYQPIVVEKALYWNAGGVTWAAGTNVTGTRLPPP